MIGLNHTDVGFMESEYLSMFPGPRFTVNERVLCADIINRCLESKRKWKDVLLCYGSGFDFSGHSISWLHRNLREVINKMPDPPRNISADIAAQDAKNRAQLEEFL